MCPARNGTPIAGSSIWAVTNAVPSQLLTFKRNEDALRCQKPLTVRKTLRVLPHRLKRISLAAMVATSCVVLGASGQIASAAATDEPVEPLSPYARTGFAYGIVTTEAVLVGFVNARGSSTTARFQVGRTKSYGRWFPAEPPEHFYSGFHRSEVEQGVDRLRPRTTYHFRLVATNAGGTTYGKDKTFRTRARGA
jgi:hypothetical protein